MEDALLPLVLVKLLRPEIAEVSHPRAAGDRKSGDGRPGRSFASGQLKSNYCASLRKAPLCAARRNAAAKS